MNRNERIDYYCEHVYHRVEGWLRAEIAHVIRAVGEIQERQNVRGDLVEFGVHHGKFLLLIDALRERGEKTIAVDLFDDQDLSSHDPEGERENLAKLRDNIGLLPWGASGIEIVARDTLSFKPGDFLGVKFFSVDAGHTPIHAFNDLLIAQEALVPGGVIAFDDFFSPCWPGATEGFYDFMRHACRRLKPLLYYKGKMFLTTASEHRFLLAQYHELLAPVEPRAVIKRFAGHECLVMSWEGF